MVGSGVAIWDLKPEHRHAERVVALAKSTMHSRSGNMRKILHRPNLPRLFRGDDTTNPARTIGPARSVRRFGGKAAIAVIAALLASACVGEHSRQANPSRMDNPDQPIALNAIAADEQQAALIGHEILTGGGNAVDAVVAAGFTMAVTLPSRVGLGGGGVCVIHDGRTGTIRVADFLPRSTGSEVPAPALVDGLTLIHAAYGTRRWETLVSAAERLARFGHTVPATLRDDFQSIRPMLDRAPELAALYDGSARRSLEQTDLAQAFETVRLTGVEAMRSGPLAEQYTQGLSAAGLTPPSPSAATQTARWVEPLTIQVGNDLLVLPPEPESGGPDQAEIWRNTAQGGDLAAASDAERVARLVQAQRQAFADSGRTLPGATVVAISADETAAACGFTLNGLFGAGRIAAGTGVVAAAPSRPMTRVMPGVALLVNQPKTVALLAMGGADHVAALSVPLAETILGRRPVREAVAVARAAPESAGSAMIEDRADPSAIEGLRQSGSAVTTVPQIGRATGIFCDWERGGLYKNCFASGDGRTDSLGARAGI